MGQHVVDHFLNLTTQFGPDTGHIPPPTPCYVTNVTNINFVLSLGHANIEEEGSGGPSHWAFRGCPQSPVIHPYTFWDD